MKKKTGKMVIALILVIIINGCHHFIPKGGNNMDTTKSDKIVKKYRNKKKNLNRQDLKYSCSFNISPEKLFPLLCPSREADWIPDWTVDLVYTETGYAENLCIFNTDNDHGNGIWIFTKYEPNESAGILRIEENLITYIDIILQQKENNQTNITWNITQTALNEKGNDFLKQMPSETVMAQRHKALILEYFKQKNTDKSDQIVEEFLKNPNKFHREKMTYKGTWKTDINTLFPLFCPAREADWIPGWNADLVYTESGYAEDKCIFHTDTLNPSGPGIWIFTGYEKNKYIQFVKYDKNIITHCHLSVMKNDNGTISAIWDTTLTAVTEKGNKILISKSEKSGHENNLREIIEYYLENGRCIDSKKGIHQLHH